VGSTDGEGSGFESGDLGFHYNGDIWGNHLAFNWKQIAPDGFTRNRRATLAMFHVWDYGRAQGCRMAACT